MSGYFIILTALSMAFTQVEILKLGVTKPFNCTKCMTGWLSLIIAAVYQVPYWPYYLFIGLFVGALFEAIKMRWL